MSLITNLNVANGAMVKTHIVISDGVERDQVSVHVSGYKLECCQWCNGKDTHRD